MPIHSDDDVCMYVYILLFDVEKKNATHMCSTDFRLTTTKDVI